MRLEDMAVIMNEGLDDVAVAKEDLSCGTILKFNGNAIKITNEIRKGHRFALHDIKRSRFIRQYGYAFARSRGISKGEMISVSNIKNELPTINLKGYKKPDRTRLDKQYLKKTFLGYRRKNGRTGTRNYYLIIPTSMCASQTTLQVAANLENNKEIVKRYPNIDGVVAIPHTEGCGCDSGMQIDRFMTVLKGYACHPNVGGCLIMDLGCEQTNYKKVYAYLKDIVEKDPRPIDWLTIQESGGTRSTIEKAGAIVQKRMVKINQFKRNPAPIADIILGTECGASDSFSGITANPVIGNVADKIVLGGGSAVLSEVPEMLGTFEMLLQRFRDLNTAYKFRDALKWYVDTAEKLGLTLEPNLVQGNIEGGLINNYIKSLGAVMKGGTTVIEDVIEYGEPLREKGLSIMQGPGNDLESVTGMVASGVTIICFSTGRGTVTGNAICPVIKVASNEDVFRKLPEDMDFDASRLLRENVSIDILGEQLLDKVIAVASGEMTLSEKWKQRQFQVWTAVKLSL